MVNATYLPASCKLSRVFFMGPASGASSQAVAFNAASVTSMTMVQIQGVKNCRYAVWKHTLNAYPLFARKFCVGPSQVPLAFVTKPPPLATMNDFLNEA